MTVQRPGVAAPPIPSPGSTPAPSSHPAVVAQRGDVIAAPIALPTDNPMHVCPDPGHDRYPAALAIGLGVAAIAPLVPEIAEAAGLDATANLIAARAVPVATALADLAKLAAKTFADDAAPLLRGFSTPEAAAKTIGSQAWKATEESFRGSIAGAGFAVGATLAHRGLDALAHRSAPPSH